MIDKITIIVGLGNPGKKYASTYHNVGQLLLFLIGEEKRFGKTHPLFNSLDISGEHSLDILHLVEPKTFMNESGQAVKAALKHFRGSPSSLMILHDDFDIPLGEFRIVKNRGSAGHHGVDSIMQEIKTKDFWRVRIGVRTSDEKAGELALLQITNKDKKILQGVFQSVREKVIEKT